ncbi:MAG: tyrosine-type recombinase/integrase [Planctomycetes bacterium]|nr:tyrosine-type recombinase/integrase [Planctomycetota bacterium]
MRLSECLAHFLTQCDADGRSSHTRAQHERSIRWLIEALSDRDVDEVGHEDIARFLVSDAARKTRFGFAKSEATTNALRTSVRCFFRYAHDAGYARVNAARLVRRALCSPAPPRGLSDDELARLEAIMAGAWSESARRDRVLVHLLLATGIRLGSALALDVRDADLDRGELALRTMKNASVGRVYLNARVADELRSLIGKRGDGPLFASQSGERLGRRHAQRRVVGWLRAAGARTATAHTLRHCFGQRLIDKTGDLALVQAAMCHRSVVSTTVYVRVSPERLRAAVS